MSGKISTHLIKLRSERIRTRLFRAQGIVDTAAAVLRDGSRVNGVMGESLSQALLAASELMDDAAGELQGEVMVQSPTAEEREAAGEEEERRLLYEAELDRLPSDKPN